MKNELSNSEASLKTDNRFSCRPDSNFERLCVNYQSTIFMAMEAIELGRERLCFVVDDENTLIRVISDGDIRRALLNGYSLDDPVRDIHDKTPVVIHENNLKSAQSNINILKAELSYLKRPDRIERIALNKLELREVSPTDVWNLKDLVNATDTLGKDKNK